MRNGPVLSLAESNEDGPGIVDRVCDAQAAARPRDLRLRHLALDQLIYSASNFGLAVVGGRSLLQEDFGRFAFVILVISIVVNLGKATWHEPDLASGSSRLLPSSLLLASSGIVALVIGSLAVTFDLESLAVVSSAAAVGALLQDRARYRALAARQMTAVMLGDGLWLAVIGLAFINHHRFDRADQILLVWLFGAVIGLIPPALATAVSSRSTVGLRAIDADSRVTVMQRKALLVDFMLFAGMTQIGGLGVALFLTLESFASLRGAIIIFGPIGILTGALTTWIFGSLRTSEPIVPTVAKRAAVLFLLSMTLTGLIALVPRSVGQGILGSAWPPRWVLVGIGLSVSLQALSTPGMMILRLLDLRRPLLELRLGAFGIFVVAVLGTAFVTESAIGTAMAYTVVNGALTAGVWIRLASMNRRRVALR